LKTKHHLSNVSFWWKVTDTVWYQLKSTVALFHQMRKLEPSPSGCYLQMFIFSSSVFFNNRLMLTASKGEINFWW